MTPIWNKSGHGSRRKEEGEYIIGYNEAVDSVMDLDKGVFV